ncbi:MAG: TIGR00300 family protein [Actinomycetota bacterium]|jgi:lysine-ketoglutarate reductase/saccharopine dehydrogenase-like protein (TIGR00300 family)|nr:TIGR00300 family protein [Actinomycetota bacterium]MDZ4180722.1 TIGR00300 family protein [Coriobacteriia bacterium]
MTAYEDVSLTGHLIDSGIMSAVMDAIVEMGGEFETLSFEVGRTNEDESEAQLRIRHIEEDRLEEILHVILEHGAVPLDPADAELVSAPCDGVFPEGFYSTTNLPTSVRIDGRWIRVDGVEMDLGILVESGARTARTVPMADARAGDLFVVGHQGLRVKPQERPRASQAFEFMSSAVSSEKPKAQVVAEVARLLRQTREAGKSIIIVAGPAVVHTGAAPHLSRLVRSGYVSVLFGGNAVAVHDIESALYGTSLGVSMSEGRPTLGGHEHHLRAINTIRGCGSIAAAVEQGVLVEGLMHTLVETGTPFVLAGSIRDDGPLPDVITDAVEAQTAMRRYCRDAGACLMFSTMLHSIATGNMLPADTATVCVDINPAVVTKLADRGSWQTIGIVTDVGLFLEQLANDLAP